MPGLTTTFTCVCGNKLDVLVLVDEPTVFDGQVWTKRDVIKAAHTERIKDCPICILRRIPCHKPSPSS
jgi:hypothetical protein